ncbi:copper homeostasis membrane protein CopD [Robbsia andropogonis]|uniref:copper homeostasis membrane protein CopD n=1 Tax=Robbsia andropogonis TaxID=28092 RepID=UPI000464A96C|nr:copper homeostasis membrane protein CopD [Robbsia andropogonis]
MSVESALVVCRFLHFAALFAWFGRTLFVGIIAMPGAARHLICVTRRTTWWMAVLTLLSAYALVPIETAQMTGGWDDAWQPSMWLAVLDTPFGAVWRLHLVLVLATTPLALARSRALTLITLAGTAALLMTLGLEGHAAMLSGWGGALQRTNHALHLLATAAWAGMLPLLLPILSQLSHTPSSALPRLQPYNRAEAQRTLQRFSIAGHIAVALVVATGIANIAWILGTLPWTGTMSNAPYRDGLMEKCVLVAAMIAIALVNRYGIVPAMRHVDVDRVASTTRRDRLQRLQRAFALLTWIEIGIALVVIALVSHFATLDPH